LTSIVHVLHVRSSKSVFKTSVTNNKPLLAGVVAMLITFALIVALPVGQIFGLTTISAAHWLIVLALILLPTAVREIGIYVDNIPYVKKQHQAITERFNKIHNKIRPNKKINQ